MNKTVNFIFLSLLFFGQIVVAHPEAKTMVCYHWLTENVGTNKGRLTTKYKYAAENNGSVFNKAGGGGEAAGPGLYCAKNTIDSRSYGDRVIKIEFVILLLIQEITVREIY